MGNWACLVKLKVGEDGNEPRNAKIKHRKTKINGKISVKLLYFVITFNKGQCRHGLIKYLTVVCYYLNHPREIIFFLNNNNLSVE